MVLCLVIPALLSMRPRQEIARRRWESGLRDDVQSKAPTLAFADVGGLEEAKKQIRDLVQANLNAKEFGQYGVLSERHPAPWPAGNGKNVPGGGGCWRV